jgi:hypothetical protein
MGRVFAKSSLPVFGQRAEKLTIIDDCAITGELLKLVREELYRAGFNFDNLKTAVLVCQKQACTQDAKKEGKKPDFYKYSEDHAPIIFPWGATV